MRYSPITRLLDPDQLQRDIAAEEAKAVAAKKTTTDRGSASRSTPKKKKPAPKKQPVSTLLQRLNARQAPPGGWDEKDKVGGANRPGEPGNGARESIPQSSTLTPDSSILTPEPTISADPCPSVAEKPVPMISIEQARFLRRYMPAGEHTTLIENAQISKERDHFRQLLWDLDRLIRKGVPKLYSQDGLGDRAIVHLHYFFPRGSGDWYITELERFDPEKYHIIAFGLCSPFGDAGELGNVSITEIIAAGVELDLHWTPKPLCQIRGLPDPDATPDPKPLTPHSSILTPDSSIPTPDSSILTPEPTISADPCPSVAGKPTTPPSSLLTPELKPWQRALIARRKITITESRP